MRRSPILPGPGPPERRRHEWGYPEGVALLGMMRWTDATGDKDVSQFVVQHNLICARYYDWLAGLEKSLGPEASSFTATTKIKNLMTLGSLDTCGAMGNEIVECLIRHPETATPEEKAVVARTPDQVVHKQDRLPDGTLWRPEQIGGTVWPDDLYMGSAFLVRYGIYTGDRKYI